MSDNTNKKKGKKGLIITIILIIIVILLLLFGCENGLLKDGKGKTTNPTEDVSDSALVNPSADDSLVYSGVPQELLNAGKVPSSDYEFKYSMNENGPFSSDVPKMTDAGEYTVYWRYLKKGKLEDSGSVEAKIAKGQDKATVVAAKISYDSNPHTLIASAKTKYGADIEFKLAGKKYSSKIPQGTEEGKYKVYWRTKESSNYYGDKGVTVVTIKPKAEPKVSITYSSNLFYNGKDQNLIKKTNIPSGVSIEYWVDSGDKTQDYTSVTAKIPATYTVHWSTTETEKYAESEGSKKITIAKAPLKNIVFNESLPYSFDGDEHSVSIYKVFAGKEGDLVEVDEYDLDPANVTSASAVGAYKVKVSAKAGSSFYTGSAEAIWAIGKTGLFGTGALKIEGSDQTYSASDASFDYTGSKITPNFKVEADGVTLKLGTDYSVVKADTTSSATNAGTYTIKVKGIGTYKDAGNIATATWKINPVEIGAVTFTPTEFEYSGETQVPTITVKNSAGNTLTKDTDYTVSYNKKGGDSVSSPKDIGKYTATVKGKGNYTGEDTSVEWEITEDYVAQIGQKKYSSLAKALADIPAGSSKTIIMLDPVVDTKDIVVPSNIEAIIDFKGLSYTFDTDKKFSIPSDSTITMRNGTVSRKTGNASATAIESKGTLVLDKMTVNDDVEVLAGGANIKKGTTISGQLTVGDKDSLATASSVTLENGSTIDNFGACAIDVCGAGIVDISGAVNGKVDSTDGTSSAVVNVRQGAVISGARLTEGGSLETGSDVGIYMPNGSLMIVGGTVKGTTAVYYKSTAESIKITGGSLSGLGADEDYSFTSEGCFATGDALVVDKCDASTTDVQINGGYFYSKNASSVGSYAGNGQAASMSKFISGGFFSDSATVMNSADPSILIADGYKATDKTDNTFKSEVSEDRTIYYTVTTGSYGYDKEATLNTNINTPTMNPENGVIEAGKTIKLTTATSKVIGESEDGGFKLDGWAVKNSDGTYTSISDDKSGTLNYVPMGNVTIVARYVYAAKPVYHLTVYADSFKITYPDKTSGENQEVDETISGDYDVKDGSRVTVTYTGTKTFKGWKNGSDKVMTTEKSYTFDIGSQMTLEAITEDVKPDEKSVKFYTADNVLISFTSVTADTVKDLILPDTPVRSGYDFDHWDVKNSDTDKVLGETTSSAGLRTLISDNFTTVSSFKVIPVYNLTTEKCTVTIVYTGGSKETVEVTKGITSKIKATKEIKGKVFSNWSNDKDGKDIFSYENPCSIYVGGDKTIYANYATKAADKVPTATLSAQEKITEGTDHYIRLALTWSVPDGYTLIEEGFLYSVSDSINESDLTTANAAKNANIFKEQRKNTSASGTLSMSLLVTGHEDFELKARGYIIYKKADALDPDEIYTKYFDSSWNGMK